MKREVPGQPSLFDLLEPEHVAADKSTAQPVMREFNANLLAIIDHNGEPHVTATAACNAIRYGEVIHFREFIKRLDKNEQWGDLSYRTIHVRTKNGARHKVDEPILTEKQLIIVYMQSALPHMAFVRSKIADVFIAWRHGRLTAADAETETKILDSTDQAFNAAPEAEELLAKLVAANDNALKAGFADLKQFLREQQPERDRKDFSKKQKDLYARVLDEYYGGLDPVIGKFKLTDGKGHLLEHPAVELDHHNGLRWDNRTANGWPLSPEAHKQKTTGNVFHLDFDRFQQKRLELEQREAADADKQPHFEF